MANQHDAPWPDILHYAVLCLNSRPYDHLQGISPYEAVFNLKHRNLKQRSFFLSNYKSNSEHKALFDHLDRRIEGMVRTKESQMAKKLQETQDLSPNYEINDLVYVKDFRLLPHKKFKGRFISTPYSVIKNLGKVLIVQDFQGITLEILND